MKKIFTQFKEKVLSSGEQVESKSDTEKMIALGVLLWAVAQADEVFLPKETGKIKEVLVKHHKISDEDMSIVLQSIDVAHKERIDMHAFTSEVSHELERADRIEIIEDLFRVACIDQDLDEKEHGMIRLISSLFRLDHKEFINSKVKVKKEFGMDTAGL